MRKTVSIISSIAIVSLAGLLILSPTTKHGDQRMAFEKFLNDQMSNFTSYPKEQYEAKPKFDRPDLAGMTEYLKTVDPLQKHVPSWRSVKAYNQMSKRAPLKSGSKEISWTSYPSDMGGRTRAIMYDPNDPNNNKVWAGSVTGGIWFNNDPINNESWQPVNDFYPNLAISCFAYDPNNKNNMYAGTGEGQTAVIMYRESSGRGAGIYHSSDGGQSWNLLQSTSDWAYVTDIVIRIEDGGSVIYAGVISGIYQGIMQESNPSDGLYRSSDGGETWTQVLPLVPGGHRPYAPSDVEISSDGSKIFVGTTHHWIDRDGAASILSSNNGIDWEIMDTYYTQISSESRYKYPGRVILANSPSNPEILYAAIASGYDKGDSFIWYECRHILKTSNKGNSWIQINHPDGFAFLAWHALAITVSPLNPDLVWIGGTDVWRTFNAGASWRKHSDWGQMYGNGSPDYVHADIHSIKFKPGSDTEMIISTDGGIFGTSSASGTNPTFFELNKNYSTLQYYSCAIHPQAGAIHFMGGLQDNGTMFYRRGKKPTFTDMLSGGDGALCFIDEDNPLIHLSSVYNNQVFLYNAQVETQPINKDASGQRTGTFLSAMDYNSRDDILFANRMKEEGTYPNQIEVMVIEENININRSSRSLNTNINVPYSTLKYSPFSPSGKSTLFIGSMAGHLFIQEDAVQVGNLKNITQNEFPTAFISCIDIGQSEDTLLVTFSNYGVESVWLTTNGGQDWSNMEGNLPDIPVRWALLHPQHGIEVMLATELGIWTTANILADQVIWTQNISGMANVRVDMIKFRKSDNTVLAATHGRGMFTGIWNPDFSSSVDKDELHSDMLVYPNPSNGEFTIQFRPDSSTELIISDMTGRIVLREEFEPSLSVIEKTIDLSRQPKGFYLVSLTSTKGKKVSKLLIQ